MNTAFRGDQWACDGDKILPVHYIIVNQGEAEKERFGSFHSGLHFEK